MRGLQTVILAGGVGRRLQPAVARRTGGAVPKQFCRFGRARSLLQETLARTRAVSAAADTVVVVTAGQERIARDQLAPFPEATLLAQPRDRGTGPAALWPLARLAERAPDACVLLTPADHGVDDPDEFARGVRAARQAVEGALAPVVLLGVEPTQACSDYGWIAPGGDLGQGIRRVDRFLEKPPPDQARRLHAAGALWSTMVLVARARALVEVFRRVRPGLVALFEALERLPAPQRAVHLGRIYRLIGRCDFSHDVLARAEGLGVCRWRRRLGWIDLGTPERLDAWLQADRAPSVLG